MGKEIQDSQKSPATEEGPLSLQSLRFNQSFSSGSGVKKLLTTVPVKKPNSQDFVRTHADEKYRGQFILLELQDDNRETYLLSPELRYLVESDAFPAMLFTAISRQGVLFLWKVKLPREEGKTIEWHRSALEAAEMASSNWIRMTSNMSLGAYEIFKSSASIPEPEWPTESFEDLLNIAFKGRVVTQADHPVIRKLRGEI